jgi:hypothetical protein
MLTIMVTKVMIMTLLQPQLPTEPLVNAWTKAIPQLHNREEQEIALINAV